MVTRCIKRERVHSYWENGLMEGFKVQKGRESALLLGEWAYGGF